MPYSTTEFEHLYIRCFPQAMKLAVSLLGREDEARDVVHEVFAKLWESGMRVGNPGGYVARAVRNASLNRVSTLDMRERMHRRLPLEHDDYGPDHDARSAEVSTAIEQLLTAHERRVVDKIYACGLTYKQTAECLGVSVSAVNKSVVGALKKLRSHFNTYR